MWLCGGSILVVPCSRVGHVFRVRRPYKGKPDMADENLFNSLRTVKVWFDEYEVNGIFLSFIYFLNSLTVEIC